MGACVVWLNGQFRLRHNSLFMRALPLNGPVVPVYCHATDAPAPLGGASAWWLHHSLLAFARQLQAIGSQLTVLHGPAVAQLVQAITTCHATTLVWSPEADPAVLKWQKTVVAALAPHCHCIAVEPNLLIDPVAHLNQQGNPFQVFTPFWRAWQTQHASAVPTVATPPQTLPAPACWPNGVAVDTLNLLPSKKLGWDVAFYTHWQPGEDAAQAQLQYFLTHALAGYATQRNRPDLLGTSRLSPYLHWGQLAIADVWQQTVAWAANTPDLNPTDVSTFLAELGWREFAYYLLHHFPHTTTQPLRPAFNAFAWQENAELLKAWQTGQTGYPIVDAGMRELWATGWMHNRVRMIVASFLVKQLRLHWLHGAQWFMDTLVDADMAANTLGWQWSAGCGADAAPYFRIFNPVLQGQKFDPDGAYVQRWVPELANVPIKHLHQPWQAPSTKSSTGQSGLLLLPSPTSAYPAPVVDHALSRQQALAAFQQIKQPLVVESTP
jgi:deoxyribodipyrimidine photo-lyase